jgi:hypothetical protein
MRRKKLKELGGINDLGIDWQANRRSGHPNVIT